MKDTTQRNPGTSCLICISIDSQHMSQHAKAVLDRSKVEGHLAPSFHGA